MKDIKEVIKQSGFHVHIINELNTGTSYEVLANDLKVKGCKLTAKELHDYHQTMRGYEASRQKKPMGENTTDLTTKDKATVKELIEIANSLTDANTDDLGAFDTVDKKRLKQMFLLLHNLFMRQTLIVFNLQSEHLNDELILMNNELKNLQAIKGIYFDALKIGVRKWEDYWDLLNKSKLFN